MTTTYVDANALIVAYRGDQPAAQVALALLGDPARRFVASPYLRLETLRKPLFQVPGLNAISLYPQVPPQ